MMRRLLLLSGLLLLPLSAFAQENLYDMFRERVREELADEEIDEPVIDFLRGVYKDRWPMGTEEIKAAIRGEHVKACDTEQEDAPQRFKGDCGDAVDNIKILAGEEQALRTFGRELQRIAASQELPMSEIPGRPFHLTTDLSGILNIWRAGTGSIKNSVTGALLVRTRPLKENEGEIDRVREAYEEVAGGLKADMQRDSGQNWESFVGKMAYFQYGARLRTGARSPTYPPPIKDNQSGPGTERQYLFDSSYASMETLLTAIWDDLPKDRDDFDPPLSKNEVAYILFPDELTQLLPENVLIWARVDGAGEYVPGVGESGDHALGDVGLAWKYPLEPMLPALLSNETGKSGEPILGGMYPPEPATPRSSNDDGSPAPPGAKNPLDGRGLCSMATAQRGYLCRPVAVVDEQRCPKEDDTSDEENVITLVSCTLEEKPTLTVAGADACREIEWLNGEQQKRCNVEFYQGDCGAPARADPKKPNGSLGICIGDTNGVNLTYIIEHELVHAQQFCSMEPGNVYEDLEDKEADALCCRLEGEAHLVSCKRMYDDGLLREDGAPAFIKGVEVTPQTCMEIGRLKYCTLALERDVKCPSTIAEFTANDMDALEPLMQGNLKDLPSTFEESTDPETMDARVAARIRTIERQIPVCKPGTESAYKNTIGNNACYIGQCVEETLELHRVTGGRSPATVGDGAFPHDDPDTGDALATMLRSVPATSPPLPTYRPQMVMRILEDALCQLQGLPAATPPHLCAFSSSRRLALPLEDGASTARSLVFSAEEQREARALMEQLGAALGSRIGTDMQGQYLRIGTRTLSEVVALANTLLKETLSVTFPANMCPLSL